MHELDLSILPRMMLIDERAAPPHPFLPPVLEKLSLAQRLHRYGSSMSHWEHLLWMLPLSIFAAIGLLHLTNAVRSSALMQRATDALLHAIQLTQDSLHAAVQLWRWYWREQLQPLDHAIEERTSWIRQRARAASEGIGAAAAAVQSRLQSISDLLSQPRGPVARQAWEWASLQLHSAVDKMRNSPTAIASLATDVSRTVTKAYFAAISPSPPAPFDYSTPLASPLSIASTEGEEFAKTASRGRMVRERQQQRQRSPVSAEDGRDHFQDLTEETEPGAEHTGFRVRLQRATREEAEEEAGEGERKLNMDLWAEAMRNREAERAIQLLEQMERARSDDSISESSRASSDSSSSSSSSSASSSAGSMASVSSSHSQAST